MNLGSWKIDDLVTFACNTHDPETAGNPAIDADSVPTYRVYEDETGTPILTGSMAKLDDANTVGFYSEQITLSAANGFEKGKSYNIRIEATVGGVVGVTLRNLQVVGDIEGKIDTLDGNVDDIELLLAAIDADVTAILADTGTDGVALASSAVDAIHDEVVEGTLTHRQIIRLVLASVAGKLSGAATTTVSIRDVADTKARITATVDADGNRTAVTLDGA